MAYHGGQEKGSVSVGNNVKGRGSPKDWLREKEEEQMPGLFRHRKRDLQHFKSGSPAGEKIGGPT